MLFRSRAGRPPAPEGPADARRPPPRRPPPETRGRARPRPSNPHTPGAAGPAGPRPLAPAHPLGGPLPEPAFPGTLPRPPHHHRGRREGAPTGSWAPSGQGTRVRGTGEARTGRENRTDGRGRRGGWGTGREKAPRLGRRGEARRLATGAAGPERQTDGRPATGRGRPAQGRRREAAGQGKRPRDGEPPPATPHSPPDATGGSAPRGSAAFVGGGSRGRRHGAKGAWGGVGAWGACGANPLTTPPPNPRGQPRGTWRGGPGYREEGTHAGGRRHRATGQGGGAPPAGWGGTEARRGRRREEGRGRASRRRRTRLFPPDIPTTLPRRPPTSLARLLAPQTHRGVAPDRPPAARGGRGALRTRLALPLSPPPGPIPRRTGGGEAREPGAGRGEAPAPLSEPTALMILPQVHLRKPCYDFYFL